MFDQKTYGERLDEWAERLSAELSAGRLWLRGLTGSGRHSIAQRLSRAHGVIAIEVPPLADLDAALHALAQAALHGGCLQEIIDRPRLSLEQHASAVGHKLAARGTPLAIVLPVDWSDRRGAEHVKTSRDRLVEVLRGLTRNEALHVLAITGFDEVPPVGFEQAARHTLEAPTVSAEHLRSEQLEGAFRAATERVVRWMSKHKISCSPLEARLHVGIVALGEAPVDARLEGLAYRLAEAVGSRPLLASAVRRFLVARRPLPQEEVLELSGIASDYLPLLTSCIGYGHDHVRVPERTRQVLNAHLDKATDRRHDIDSAHAALANYHATLDGAVSPRYLDASSAVHWLEKVHHLAQSGDSHDRAWGAQHLLGREQIWERARYLSRALRRYDEAARLYRQCIDTFGEDSYSLHYEAFNLARAGGAKRLVRDGYARAVSMDQDNPWWNARWITFLIANGTLAEAEQAWRAALRRIDPTGDRMAESPWLAVHLHRWVCRQWLALGYVQQARNALNEIDPRWLDAESQLSALRALVEDHEEAIRLGESVYPAEVPHHERWRKPRELDARNAERSLLLKWYPGRVLEARADEVVTVLADPETRLAQQVTFTAQEWRDAANQPPEDAEGFFEIGEYVGGDRIVRRTRAVGWSPLDEEYEALVGELRP